MDSIPAAGADIREVELEPDMLEEELEGDMPEEPGVDILKDLGLWSQCPAVELPIPEVRLLVADYNHN